MKIDAVTYDSGSGTLEVNCSGRFGVGTEGQPSVDRLSRIVERWLADHPEKPVTEIEIDYTSVDYSWGDGPVSSVLSFMRQGVAKFRFIGSSSNCDSFKNLLDGCNLPWFELVRSDEIEGKRVLTPVPLKLSLKAPPDETKLSVRARDFVARLFDELPELKLHSQTKTVSSDECALLIQAESPTRDAERWLEISFDAAGQAATVSFGNIILPVVGVNTIIGLLEGIVHDRLVLAVNIDGSSDRSETLVDLGDFKALKEELTGPHASGRVQILSWGGSAERQLWRADFEGR